MRVDCGSMEHFIMLKHYRNKLQHKPPLTPQTKDNIVFNFQIDQFLNSGKLKLCHDYFEAQVI